MPWKASISVKAPRLDKLKSTFSTPGRRVILSAVAWELEQEVKENFDMGGKKKWAKWAALKYSTKYAKKIRGGSMVPLAGLKENVGSSFGATQATVYVKGKIAAFHHYGTDPHRIPARGSTPLWFPYHKGKVIRKDGTRWFRGWLVKNHPGVPERPLVPDEATVKRIARKVINRELKLEAIRGRP